MPTPIHDVYRPLYENDDKFIVLITGGRGCEDPNTEVLMGDLTVRRLADVCVGDQVMGDDGTPRTVLATHSGRSEMYWVRQKNAEDYLVNADHILTVKKSESAKNDRGGLTRAGTYRRPNGRYPQYPDVADINVLEYANKSGHFQANFKGFKSGSIPYPESAVDIEPYLLGLWLGDGTGVFPNITNGDNEVIEWVRDYCKRTGQECHERAQQGALQLRIVTKRGGVKGSNAFLNSLRRYDLLGNKHIPQEYISNSERVRLELLAGIIDTDGYYDGNDYEVTQKSEALARQVKLVADTLGFRTSINEKTASIDGTPYGPYWRVFISGDLHRIPCKVERKRAHEGDAYTRRSWLVSALTIEPAGVGDWCGITLDGNQRYLHADGTVTHNSGKSYEAARYIERLTFEENQKILFSRYTMTSADKSVIPEVMDKIRSDGTADYFSTKMDRVKNTLTGSEIIFMGIKASSGNQTAKLKSIQGLSTFVCDEAEEWVSEEEYDKLVLSLRKKGVRNCVIIVMNPSTTSHFIYQKYIKDTHKLVDFLGVPVQISTHPRVLHIHTTYQDNLEYLSDNFITEVEELKRTDPEKYAHTVAGQWSEQRAGLIFPLYEVVDEMPERLLMRAIGLDFGYTNDPSAGVMCGVDGNDLYMDELFYAPRMGYEDLADALQPYGLHVIADSSEPREIDEIAQISRAKGQPVNIFAVKKGSGSILAGIQKMQEMTLKVTRRSVNLIEELQNYVWDTDRYGRQENKPVDRYNHAIDAVRYYVLGELLGQRRRERQNWIGI